MAEARILREADVIQFTTTAAVTSGSVVLCPDGRAGVSINDAAANELVSIQVTGIARVTAGSTVVFAPGQTVEWDDTNSTAVHAGGDWKLGIAVNEGTIATAGTTVDVELNTDAPAGVERFGYAFSVTNGGLVTQEGDAIFLELTSAAEAQRAEALGVVGIAQGSDSFVFSCNINVLSATGAAVDLNIGVANAGHASDADSITEAVFCHVNGGSVNILAESDDGTTEVAATDTTVDYTAGTRFNFTIVCTDTSDIQLYIEGVNVLPASVFKLNNATGPMLILLHAEKSSDAATATVRVDDARLWKISGSVS